MSTSSPRLSEDRIVQAAIRMLARSGVEKFSMRALAQQLDVALGAAYTHVGGKERVLALAADRIVRGIRLDDAAGRGWQQQLIDMAFAYRRTFERYPGIGAYLTLHLGESPASHQAMEQATQIISESGLDRPAVMRTAAVLNAYIRASVGDAEHRPRNRSGRPAQQPGRTPTRLDDETFSHGLDLLIRGISSSSLPDTAAPDRAHKRKG